MLIEMIKVPRLKKFYVSFIELPDTARTFYRKQRDLLGAYFNPPLRQLHLRIRHHFRAQKKEWPHFVYSWGYCYQGWKKIGVTGARETDLRMAQYNITPFLKPDMIVLDIGANTGFCSLKIAPHVRHVDAVEWNHHLCSIGQETAAYLGINTIRFHPVDFNHFVTGRSYDIIFSFAAHHTTDGGMRPSLKSYFTTIHGLLSPHGHFFFETHPQEVNDPAFHQDMASIQDLFECKQRDLLTDGKLGGVRYFYVLQKK